MFKREKFECRRFISSSTIDVNGKAIAYECISEDNPFYSDDGEIIASIFSFSYFRKCDDNTSRPVVFAFNGGPGSSSVMLHSALLGPKRIVYSSDLNSSDFKVEENSEWLLDIADIVLVDPVSTGFGTLLDSSCSSDFFGIKQDAEAFVSFVEMWLRRYNRYKSRKYIIAESYGCARAAMALEIASGQGRERCYDISFDGVVFIGNTISEGGYFNVNLPVEKSVIGFETYAALNWFHNTDHSISLESWESSAREFANSEYLVALNKGNELSENEREDIISKIIHFTGVGREYLERKNLKLNSYSIKNEILRTKGLCVSRLDGRITRPLFSSFQDEEKHGLSSDRARGVYNPIFLSVLTDYIFPEIGIRNFERPYISQLKISKDWDKSLDISLSECLERVMKRCPDIRFFFANGYFDLTTEIGGLEYMLRHTDLDRERYVFKGYPTGHMVYLGNDEFSTFSSDLREFIY